MNSLYVSYLFLCLAKTTLYLFCW